MKKKTGRPSKFLPQYVAEGEKYAVVGLPLKDMAFIWGIDPNTVTNWQKRYPSFLDALKRGEAKKKTSLLTALFRNATTHNNVAAQIFLAKNWLGMSDRQDIGLGLPHDEDSGELTINVVHTKSSNGKGNGNGNGDAEK